MAFNDIEISNEDGEAVALYEFRYGATVYRYTTNDEDLIVGLDDLGNPAVWKATAITDEGVTQGGSDNNDLQITMPRVEGPAALFRAGQPSGQLWLTVRRYHPDDADDETPVQWVGTVVNSVAEDSATARLVGRSIAGTYDRQGLRLGWDRSCPHVLYGIGCYLNKAAFAYMRQLATVTANGFTCVAHSEPAEGTFAGGLMEWVRPDGSTEYRAIEFQNGNDFRVMGYLSGLTVGTTVLLYPGCNRSTTACKAFGNLKNFGGFPHLPGTSPFDGSPVF